MSQGALPSQDSSNGNFKQPPSVASSASATVSMQNEATMGWKAAGVMQRPVAFGVQPGMGPPPSTFDAVVFSEERGMGGSMPKQQQIPGRPELSTGSGKLPMAEVQIVVRQPSGEPAPEIRDTDVNWMRSLATSASPDEACTAFMTACADQNVLDVDATGFKLEGRYFSESHKMAEFYVGIYTIQSDRRSVVEVNSSQGPVFQEFLTAIFGRMSHLPDFQTEVNTSQSYSWSPLPLPILGSDEFDTPSSPDVGGGLELPPMLPLGGFPPEISLSLGFSIDGDADTSDPDAQTRNYLEDLVETLETGYAREIADAGPNLAVESEDPDALRVLRTVGNVVSRLLVLISDRLDACLVRCCVIALGNLLTDAAFAVSVREENARANLEAAMVKWAAPQKAFVETEIILKSDEITRAINTALMRV